MISNETMTTLLNYSPFLLFAIIAWVYSKRCFDREKRRYEETVRRVEQELARRKQQNAL